MTVNLEQYATAEVVIRLAEADIPAACKLYDAPRDHFIDGIIVRCVPANILDLLDGTDIYPDYTPSSAAVAKLMHMFPASIISYDGEDDVFYGGYKSEILSGKSHREQAEYLSTDRDFIKNILAAVRNNKSDLI